MNLLANALVSALADYLRKHPELISQALAWAREHVFPDLAASVAKAVVAELPNAVDKLTDAVPGQWDDKVLDGLALKTAQAVLKLLVPSGDKLGGLGAIFRGGTP